MAHNYDVYFARMVLTLGLIDRETLQRALMDHKHSGTETGFPKHLVDNGILDRLSASRAVTELERWFVTERKKAAGIDPSAPAPVALPPVATPMPMPAPPMPTPAPPPPPPVALPAPAPARPLMGSRPTFTALAPTPQTNRPTPSPAPRPTVAATPTWSVTSVPPTPATAAPRPAASTNPASLRKTAERPVPPEAPLEIVVPPPPQPKPPSRKSSASRRALRPEDLGEAPAPQPPPPPQKPTSKSSASQRAFIPADVGDAPRAKKPGSAEGKPIPVETPTGGAPRPKASSASARLRPPSDVGANVSEAPAGNRDAKQWALFNQATKDPLARLVGRRLGRTEITKLVQTGDVVTVFDGRFGDDERGASVKVLRPDKTKDTVSLQRFTREAQALGKIDHPNIARVLETGTAEGVRYMSMEVGAGEPLSNLLERVGRLPPERVARLGRGVALGLAAAHRAGIVHRDIRPASILLEGDGTVKLVGFGIAKDVAIPGRLTHTGQITGHPSYVAPELASGDEITGKSDVYSLGIVLYLALAGRLPFESRSVVKLVGLHMNAAPPSLVTAAPGCPPKLANLITLKLLAKDPAARPEAMEASLLLAAKDLLEGAGTAEEGAPPVDMEEELRRALATDELPAAEQELGGPACAACELPLGSKVTSLHGNQLCEKCLERVESLDLCAACLLEIDSSAADTAVFAGQIYCKPCTGRVRLPCAVCRKDAPLAGLASGQTKAKGDQLVHAGCAR